MTETVERTPVHDRMPWCYSQHRGDDECAACPHAIACTKAKAANAARLTVRQAADAAVHRYLAARGEAPPDVDELMAIAVRSSGVNEYSLVNWRSDPAWQRTFAVVSVVCARAGWDARTYVRAIAETVGAYAVRQGWALKRGMFVGDSACARFERWAERNRRIHGDEKKDRRSDPDREVFLAGECCFAERLLLSRSVTLADAEAFACSSFPRWALAKTAGRDDVRLPALASALASIDPGLPHRVLAPVTEWTWPSVRDDLLDLTRMPETADEEAEPLELSPELGEVL